MRILGARFFLSFVEEKIIHFQTDVSYLEYLTKYLNDTLCVYKALINSIGF